MSNQIENIVRENGNVDKSQKSFVVRLLQGLICVVALLGTIFLIGGILYREGILPFSEYRSEMNEAREYAREGLVNIFEGSLGSAQLLAEEKGLDMQVFYQDAAKIRVTGYTEAAKDSLEDAMSSANQGQSFHIRECLKDYELYCRRAGLEPDQEIIKKVWKMWDEAVQRDSKIPNI